jgi:hypothetical protein
MQQNSRGRESLAFIYLSQSSVNKSWTASSVMFWSVPPKVAFISAVSLMFDFLDLCVFNGEGGLKRFQRRGKVFRCAAAKSQLIDFFPSTRVRSVGKDEHLLSLRQLQLHGSGSPTGGWRDRFRLDHASLQSTLVNASKTC